MSNIQEINIYYSNGIQVTKTLVRIDDASYPVNGIGSVFIKPAARSFYFLLAVMFGLAAVLTANQPDTTLSTILLLITILCLIAALMKKHGLILRTSSGDQRALAYFTRKRLVDVKQAIEEAIIMRG